MIKGTVCTWIDNRAFGFILPDGVPPNGRHILVHISDCPGRKPLKVNDRVTFSILPWGDRFKAVNVTVIPADLTAYPPELRPRSDRSRS
jgi:cold shock CspA family protein